MSTSDTRVRSRLESRLSVLEERLTEMQQTLREPEDENLEEQALDLEDDDVLDRLAHAGRDEARLIRAALERLADGSYGRCVSCGKPIGERRLRALPEAATCLRCAGGSE